MNSRESGRADFAGQSGVALAILVWFLAAMSLLVASIVYQARVDIKLAQLQLRKAEAQAAGDGAIQLALADLLIRELDGEVVARGVFNSEFNIGDHTVMVRILPVIGLVDLNSAPGKLLQSLFFHVGGKQDSEAQELAQSVLKWRAPKGQDTPLARAAGAAEPRYARFESIEDLLLVYGVDRQTYDLVKDSVYVAQRSQSGVDWRSAPESVLVLLSEGDSELVETVSEFRAQGETEAMPLPAGLKTLFQEQQAIPLFRADAVVPGTDYSFLRRRWVDRTRVGSDGLPWSYFRTEPVRALSKLDRGMLRINTEGGDLGR